MKSHIVHLMMAVLLFAMSAGGQQRRAGSGSATVVPQFIKFSGVAKAPNGQPPTGMVGITFALYQEQEGGAPLWLETQNVQLDSHGNYTVQLGATQAMGLPASLFTSGEARWLGMQISGQAEQPRTLLTSVAYAMKAVDAQTLGGLPASAFVLSAPSAAPSAAPSPSVASGSGGAVQPNLSGSGTADYISLWTNSSTLGNSVLYQSVTGGGTKVGINTTTPASTLDVKGGSTVRGLFALPAAGTATATAGYDSQPIKLTASAFNNTFGAAIAQHFQWQAEPTGNNTGSPSGTLNLLFAQGTNKLAETGLNIASNGQITFASGQTFPIPNGGVTNAMLQNPSLTVNAGTAMTGGGAVSLGGITTLNLDTTQVPLLAAANTFTGTQTIDNNVSIVGTGPGSALSVSGATTGITGQTVTNGGSGLYGADTSPTGGYAIYGVSTNGTGVYGSATASSGNTIGVYGFSNSPNGVGVYGYSTVPGGIPFGGAGVYGFSNIQDGDAVEGVNVNVEGNGVVGSAPGEDGWAGVFLGGYYGVLAEGGSYENGGIGVSAAGGSYGVFSNGNLAVAEGYTKSGVAVLPDDRAVLLYSMESPENWYEDFGSGKLQNGATTINIEPTYAQTVNTAIEYHVFLTPKGDCKGLYVTNETSTTFDVRELGGGQSSVAFDYRIVAKRRGLENLRLEVISTDHEQAETMRQNLETRPRSTPVLKRVRKPPERPALIVPPQPPKPPQHALVPEPPRVKSLASQQRVTVPELPR